MMGLEDWEREADVGQCVEDGCHFRVKLTQQWHGIFLLQWQFEGESQLAHSISLASVLIVETGHKWSYNLSVVLDDVVGAVKFEAVLLDE